MISWNAVTQIFGWPIMLSGMYMFWGIYSTLTKGNAMPVKFGMKVLLWTCLGAALIWGIK